MFTAFVTLQKIGSTQERTAKITTATQSMSELCQLRRKYYKGWQIQEIMDWSKTVTLPVRIRPVRSAAA